MNRRIILSDNVLGPSIFHGIEADLLDTAELTRLREIKKLSTAYLFHPNATHTVWHHSVGVATLVKMFIAAQPAFSIDLHDQFLLVAAAFLHDTGQPAWSHLGATFAQMRVDVGSIDHDDLSAELIIGGKKYDKYFDKWGLPRIRDVIKDKWDRLMIAEIVAGRAPIDPRKKISEDEKRTLTKERAFLGNMIHGPADLDLAESLMRDSFAAMSGQRLVNPTEVVENIGIIQTSMGAHILSFLSLPFAERMMIANELLHQEVYLEAQNVMTEELLLRALLRAYPPGTDIYDFWFATDAEVMERLHLLAREDIFVGRICNFFTTYKTYDVVGEIDLREKRIDDQASMNIKLLGSHLGKHRVLELEKDVHEALRSSNVALGDIIIGCRIEAGFPVSYAALRINDRDSTVEYESRFLEYLRSEAYMNSKSRLVVGAWSKVSVGKPKILEVVLELLRTNDYT